MHGVPCRALSRAKEAAILHQEREEMDKGSVRAGERIDYLDAVRGLAILLMIFVNFIAQYGVIPAWTKHATGDGFTYVDGIAPMFVFIMGISGALSFTRRRETTGLRKTVLHALRRNGLLFFFGTIGTVLLYAAEGILEWNIFQTLAVAGVVALPFFFIKSSRIRIIAALALMVLYQLALTFFLAGALFQKEPAIPFLPSFVQSLALATIVIFGSGLDEWIQRGRTGAAAGIACAVFCGVGLGLSSLIGPNRPMGSITYLFFGLAMAAGFLLLFYLAARWLRLKRVPLLSTLGRNPLVIFMIASVFTKVLNVLLPENASALAVLSVAVALEAFCIAAARILEWKGVTIKL
jgi:predicted acyltransferase